MGKRLATLKGYTHRYGLHRAALSSDGSRAVTVDGTVRLWNARTGARIAVLRRDVNIGTRFGGFSPDGKRFLTVDKSVTIWDAQTGRAMARLRLPDNGYIERAHFSPDGRRVLTVSSDYTAQVWVKGPNRKAPE